MRGREGGEEGEGGHGRMEGGGPEMACARAPNAHQVRTLGSGCERHGS